ncbi:hypothetical protein NDU88_002326 [Pleurodeles waltl]|uniref:Uncharacterized protein n=1 Tax=Pleurodeles waltl TaxID=8319 RepID=A0AAV7TMX2_PLEWA|nr:hypothetical protein NDU88_002326 [Pleurodeles waltl]
MDPKVQEVLALLRQAVRLDLVNEEALAPGHPACRASADVAAAVAACSPPRPFDGAQVRVSKGRALREAGSGASRAVRGRVIRGGLARGSPRASHGEGRSRGLRAGEKKARRGPVVRRYGPRHGTRTEIGAEVSLGRGAALVKRAGGPLGRDRVARAGSGDQRVGAESQSVRGSRARAAGAYKLSLAGGGGGPCRYCWVGGAKGPQGPV